MAASITDLAAQLLDTYAQNNFNTFKSMFTFKSSQGLSAMQRIDGNAMPSRRYLQRGIICPSSVKSNSTYNHQEESKSSSSGFSSPSSPTIESGSSSPTSPTSSSSSSSKKRRGSAQQDEDDYDASAPRVNVIPGFPEHYKQNQWKTIDTHHQEQNSKGLSLKTIVNMLRWGSPSHAQQ